MLIPGVGGMIGAVAMATGAALTGMQQIGQATWRVENGEILAPELPGIGLDVNPDALREYRVD